MTPQGHREHLSAALSRTGTRMDRDQILAGVLVPDFGELTDEAHRLLSTEPDAFAAFVASRIGAALDPSTGISSEAFLRRSHLGDLSALHAMATSHGEDPQTTFAEILEWAEFFAQVASGNLRLESGPVLGSVPSPVRRKFETSAIRVREVFGTDIDANFPPRALGALIHIVEDFFTPAHVQLDDKHRAVKFLCYLSQDPRKHAAADEAIPSDARELQRRIAVVLERVAQGAPGRVPRIDDLFELSPDARPADGGDFG